MPSRKIKIVAAIAGTALLVGAVVTFWPKGNSNSRGNPLRSNIGTPDNPIAGQKTLADVPLFETPWNAEPDIDKIVADAKKVSANKAANPIPKIPANPTPVAVAPKVEPKSVGLPSPKNPAPLVPPGPGFGESLMEKKIAAKQPAAEQTDFTSLLAKSQVATNPPAEPTDFDKLITKTPGLANPAAGKNQPASGDPQKNGIAFVPDFKPANPVAVGNKNSAIFVPDFKPAIPAVVENKNAIAFVPDFKSATPASMPSKNALALIPFGPNFKPLEVIKPTIKKVDESAKERTLLGDAIRQISAKPKFEDWKTLNENKALGLGKKAPPIGEGRFIMAVCEDLQGRIWIGCEEEGVWCYNPSELDVSQQWQHFTRKNTGGVEESNDSTTIQSGNFLGDDNGYAIACDKQNRIWVGHLNHGVSVYNGKEWKNYNILEGPLGERVFAIATCPTDGDVWIATSAGLTRYSLSKDTWSYYTRAEGLPSDQASAIAFDKEGNIIVGTQCDGLALADTNDDYKTWRIVKCPDQYQDQEPAVSNGQGLPANFINDVKVDKDGMIYVATSTGLAWSKDRGLNFEFLRGEEWDEKVRGKLIKPGQDKPEDRNEGIAKIPDNFLQLAESKLLSEDFVSSIAIDGGNVWVGTRRGKLDLMQKTNKGLTVKHYQLATASIRAVFSSETMGLVVGQYGKGFNRIFASPAEKNNGMPVAQITPVPSPAPSPNMDELRSLVEKVALVPVENDINQKIVAPLPDDWMTRGQWLGRYGRYWMCLAAAISPYDFVWGTGAKNVNYSVSVGPHHKANESVRYWIHWNHTKHEGSLELPMPYLQSRVTKKLTTWDIDRRQSEWDDHSETYSSTYDGPDLYLNLNVPAGLFVMSLYDINKDGQSGVQEVRDFRISIKASGIAGFPEAKELANGRIRDFWGGVYKRFLVRGPVNLTIRLERRYSFATILAGASLDRLDEEHAPYLSSYAAVAEKDKALAARRREIETLPATNVGSLSQLSSGADKNVAEDLRRLLKTAQEFAPIWHSQESRRYYAALARSYQNDLRNKDRTLNTEIASRLSTCYYQLNCFSAWEETRKKLGFATSREIEKALRWDGRPSASASDCDEWVNAYRKEHLEKNKNE